MLTHPTGRDRRSDSLPDRLQAFADGLGVPGLIFSVSRDRLEEHCQARSAYHLRRAQEKADEIPDMEKSIKDLRESIDKIRGFRGEAPNVPTISNKMSNTYGFQAGDQLSELEQQIERLRADIREHQNKAATFAFLAQSLLPGDYKLTWPELQTLEIAGR